MTLVSESPERTMLVLTVLALMLVYSRRISWRHYVVIIITKGYRIMATFANEKTLTLSASALNNPALLLAEMLEQGFTIGKESPISVLGGGSYNPAIVIWTQFVKNYPPEQWRDILVKRESVLSDYYSLLRESGLAKEKIQARVDSARQFYIEYGKHDSNVSRMIAGIGAENETAESLRIKNLPKHAASNFSSNVPTVGEVYTVNESPFIMVKFMKALSNGIRVEMVKGEVLPVGSVVNLAGVTTVYKVDKIVGNKAMTLTPKPVSKTQPTTESAVRPAAKASGRVAGMPAPKNASKTPASESPTKAEVLARVMALLDTIE